MGIIHESPSAEGKQLIFDVIARNQPLEEWRREVTGSKLTRKTTLYLKNTWYDTNAFHLHTVSTRSLFFNTMTGISLLCFGNSMAHAVVFFSELAIKHASRNTERQGEATSVRCQSQLAPSVFEVHKKPRHDSCCLSQAAMAPECPAVKYSRSAHLQCSSFS